MTSRSVSLRPRSSRPRRLRLPCAPAFVAAPPPRGAAPPPRAAPPPPPLRWRPNVLDCDCSIHCCRGGALDCRAGPIGIRVGEEPPLGVPSLACRVGENEAPPRGTMFCRRGEPEPSPSASASAASSSSSFSTSSSAGERPQQSRGSAPTREAKQVPPWSSHF